MLIANPIYDAVFKYLLEDMQVAKILISNIIGENIKSLDVRPQEQSIKSASYGMTVFRMDFKAIIALADGTEKKVLIELQKSSHPDDLRRFRRYLGENYANPDKVKNEEISLPITTIYFLGFNLSIGFPLLKIGRQYLDVLDNNKVIKKKDAFIELLSHDSYVIQINQLPKNTKSKLEQLLVMFNQRWVIDKVGRKWLLNIPEEMITDDDLLLLFKRLNVAASSQTIQQQVALEQDFEYSLDEYLRKKDEKIEKIEKQIEVANKKALKLEQRSQELEQQKKEAEKREQEAENKLIEAIKSCLTEGLSIEKTAKIMKMSIENIEKLSKGIK